MTQIFLTDKGVPVTTYNILMIGPDLLHAAQQTFTAYLGEGDKKRAQEALAEWDGGISALEAGVSDARRHGHPVSSFEALLKEQAKAIEQARHALKELKK